MITGWRALVEERAEALVMKSRNVLALALLLVVTAFPVLAKKDKDAKTPSPAAPGDTGVAAYLGGEPISMEDVNKQAEAGMDRLRQQEAAFRRQLAQDGYNIKKSALDQIVEQRLLDQEAKKRSVTVDAMIKAEVEDKAGKVTKLVERARFDPGRTRAFVCGPEGMMRFAVSALTARGVSPERVFLSLERNMKCAIGFCGHCQLATQFVCRDGPVFPFAKIEPIFRVREL